MNPWRPYPLIRLLPPFLGGVCYALADGSWIPGLLLMAGMSGAFALVILLVAGWWKLPYRFRWVMGFLITGALFFAGIITVTCHREATQGSVTFSGTESHGILLAEIVEPPTRMSQTLRLTVRLIRADTGRRTWIEGGKALLFLPADGRSRELRYGDRFFFSGRFQAIRGARNPQDFDPRAYYLPKGITRQAWIDASAWRNTKLLDHVTIRKVAFSCRDRLLHILRENGLQGAEFAVASALLLGYVNELDKELRKGYAASGAMHILAVSGLHVGIIFLFLETVLSFLRRRKKGIRIQAVIMLLMIWGYAMVTGLSPPVFRASLMLSLVIAGRTTHRKPETINVVAASMTIMLISNPGLLLNLGFQFSYLAVIGILYIYPPLSKVFISRAWLSTRVWSLVAVSIAAQLATFPLGIYAFHQFPNYFILTNLIVVPMASLIIYSGISVLATSVITPLSALLTRLLSGLVWLLNSAVGFIEDLPGSTSGGIYISLSDTLFLYFLIAVIFLFIKTRAVSYLYVFLLVLIFFSAQGIFRQHRIMQQAQLVVFQVKGSSLYSFIHGKQEVCVQDIRAVTQGAYTQDLLERFRCAKRIRTTRTTYLPGSDRTSSAPHRHFGFLIRQGDFIQYGDCRIVLLSEGIPFDFTGKVHADIVIIRNNPAIDVKTILRVFSPDQIVIDASNTWNHSRRWVKQAGETGIDCHSVGEEGAVVLNVP